MEPAGWQQRLPFCERLPKVELHAHLNGSIRDSTIRELAEKRQAEAPLVAEDALRLTNKGQRSLAECFKLFAVIHSLTTDHTTITRITHEVVEDFAADNVCYLELRTTPKSNPGAGMSKQSYIEAVLAGLLPFMRAETAWLDARNKHQGPPSSAASGMPIVVRLVLSIDRRESTQGALDTVRLAVQLRSQGVVGIDLSGNPSIGQWSTYLPALQLARSHGLPITVHFAEVPNESESQAVLDFAPDRLGHACCLPTHLSQALLQSRIPVELCLTSNVRTESVTAYGNHHFDYLYRASHPVAICTDDSGVFSTTLSREYALAAAAFNLSDDHLMELAHNSIDFAFLPCEARKLLCCIFQEQLTHLSNMQSVLEY
ncbi:hypothetical protein CLOM_g8418 [Closterium sp. NIES-68]|nr:hypothetical protein CLOM_g8418 [Closterium sp. NIES-68]GJP81012.1 hypothetical protein CLOP_g11195 [Closterium sp. NIES-67]